MNDMLCLLWFLLNPLPIKLDILEYHQNINSLVKNNAFKCFLEYNCYLIVNVLDYNNEIILIV